MPKGAACFQCRASPKSVQNTAIQLRGEKLMKKLVVLGAGIGGLSVIHELKQRRCLDSGELEVTLIDKDFTHFIGFTLPWIMRGWRTPRQASITPGTQFLRGVKTINGTVTAVDS